MKLRGIFGLLAAAVLTLAAMDVAAQKFPERRVARQGTTLYRQGDYAGAEAEYKRALELNPHLREAAFNLGGALWRQATKDDGDQAALQEAVEVWTGVATDSLADGRMVSAANYNLGNVALAGQQFDAAIEAYKQALRLRPDDMQAKYNLAYAQAMKQQQEDQDNNDGENDKKQDNNDNNGQDNDDNGQDQGDDRRDGDDGNNGEGPNDPQDGDGDGDGDGGDEPPPPSDRPREATIDPRAAEQMLEAMQAAEDDTREKVNAREVQVGARSGKNW